MAALEDTVPFLGSLRDVIMLSATVSEFEQLTPRLQRIRFSGPRLRGLKWSAGQHIRVQVDGFAETLLRLAPHDSLRAYSIYDADPVRGTLDIVRFEHAAEPANITPSRRWIRDLQIGSTVRFTRPEGKLTSPPRAEYHVFAGEETASVAFAAMLRSLPMSAEVHGVVEAATETDHLTLPRELTRVERGDASAADSPVLAATLRDLPLPDRQGIAYLAGEARTIQTLKRVLIDVHGWDRRNIRTKPFWTPGRTGME
ncbi:siderophore-interacting protein [Nocardia sp. NPDC058058]|uniref:siderophore-interacting protein n=1 Tax=Nocardia sp. NPDC058058 TaxID=3346317 RepID=UPI0036DD4F61